MNGSERYPDGPSRKEPIRRPRKACTTCRALKTRCLPDGDNQDPQSRCSRCARLNLDCVYDRGRRAKRRSEDNYRSSPLSAGPSSLPQMHNTLPSDPRLGWKSVATYPHEGYRPREDVTMHQIGTEPASAPWAQGASRQGYQSYSAPLAANSFPAEPYGRSNSLDTNVSPRVPHPNGFTGRLEQDPSRSTFVEYLDPLMGGAHKSTGTSSPTAEKKVNREYNPFPSPVELGFVSEPEARHLFHQFMYRVAPCSYLFDPQFHTFERVRNSGVLLSAIMYAGARFFRPDIEEAILSLTEHLIGRSVMQGRYDLQLVQAICVVVYWKHPQDRTFYQKLGVAARLMCELRYGWPTDPSRPAPPTTEEEERQRVDIERTVHNVNTLDLAYSFLLELPPYHRPWRPSGSQVLEWAESHRHLNVTADFFKAFIVIFWEFYGTFGGHPSLDIEDIALKMPEDVYQASEGRVNAEVQRWSTTHASLLDGQYVALSQLVMKTTIFKVRVIGFFRRVQSVTTTLIFNSAEEVTDVVKRIADAGDIIFWSDIMSATISAAGAYLYSLRNHFSLPERRHATALSRKMAECLAPTLTTGGESTLRYIERFYRNLTRAFEDMSNGTTGGDDPDVMTALQTLLQYRNPLSSAPVAQTGPTTMQMSSAPLDQQQQQGSLNFLWPPDMTASWMGQGQGPG